MLIQKVRSKLNTKGGFFVLAVVLFWLKTYLAYVTKFSLGVKGPVQEFLLFLNPLAFALLLFSFALFFNGKKFYVALMTIDVILTTWLFANIVYYREFTDFITVSIMKSVTSVSNNMGSSALTLMHGTDLFVFVDVIVLLILLGTKVIKVNKERTKKRNGFALMALSVVLMLANLSLAEIDRPQLLSRTFDRAYIVKYLGLNAFLVYDAVETQKANVVRAQASSNDLDSVMAFEKTNQTTKNTQYYGKLKGKNVIIIHLESFQQFLIDYKVDGKEVTPNLNKFYHDQETLSFDNFYNQVAQGKTSDAEMMLENSLFGLSQGSAMVSNGTSNTFQAAPAIFDQQGYTTAAFHGDTATFWNRNNAYKSWGYDYFFDSSYYSQNKDYYNGYGLKDKIFLKDSVKYLEQLPQPFYSKLITVTNHYPYELDKENIDFPATSTGDATVDGYVQTAHYLDQAFGELLTYLKESGLYDNSVLMLYGDHYGISDNHKDAIKQLLNKTELTDNDIATFQKVPFMIHSTGLSGGINHTYGGEIDALPTLMNLMGIDTSSYLMMGQDLLSSSNQQTVAFRDGNYVSKNYTKMGSNVYNTQTGELISNLTTEQQAEVDKLTKRVDTQLSTSDKIINGDLLRFYNNSNFQTVKKTSYDYTKKVGLANLAKAANGTSVLAKNNNKTTTSLYKTDAPELKNSTADSSSSTSSSTSSATK